MSAVDGASLALATRLCTCRCRASFRRFQTSGATGNDAAFRTGLRIRPHRRFAGGTIGQVGDGLRICASRRTDGARFVFGVPGAPEATLAQAVAASCSIPAYLAPVTIDGVQYADGGAWSPTSADILVDDRLDLVLVILREPR